MFFFFFNDTATTEIYTLSLHDALPICAVGAHPLVREPPDAAVTEHLVELILLDLLAQIRAFLRPRRAFDDAAVHIGDVDRKSTRLNSSHANISYAVFCLKKKKNTTEHA